MVSAVVMLYWACAQCLVTANSDMLSGKLSGWPALGHVWPACYKNLDRLGEHPEEVAISELMLPDGYCVACDVSNGRLCGSMNKDIVTFRPGRLGEHPEEAVLLSTTSSDGKCVVGNAHDGPLCDDDGTTIGIVAK